MYSWVFLRIPVYSCVFQCIPVYSCVFLRIPACSCVFLHSVGIRSAFVELKGEPDVVVCKRHEAARNVRLSQKLGNVGRCLHFATCPPASSQLPGTGRTALAIPAQIWSTNFSPSSEELCLLVPMAYDGMTVSMMVCWNRSGMPMLVVCVTLARLFVRAVYGPEEASLMKIGAPVVLVLQSWPGHGQTVSLLCGRLK